MVGLFATMAFAQEDEPEIVKKSWFDLFKSTGFVGILLVLHVDGRDRAPDPVHGEL